jgi:uncharacterized protein (UPF0332 family)
MALDEFTKGKVSQYLAHAHQAVQTGRLVMRHEDYITAVNRAYYAIFYAANALLATKGLERSKHSGVIAAFRQHFVKTSLIEPEFSDYFGEALDDRHAGDYDLEALSYETALRDLNQAERFIQRVESILQELDILT